MTLMSMTGFARLAESGAGFRWNWEIKSVNGKGAEVRTKLPPFLDGFDLALKKQAREAIARGSVYVTLMVEAESGSGDFAVNEENLKQLLAVAAKYAGSPGVESARLDGLLQVKGIVDSLGQEISENQRSDLEAELSKSFGKLLQLLKSARADEGKHIQEVLNAQLAEIESLTGAAKATVGDRDEHMKARFHQQLTKLDKLETPVPDDRLAQEIAVLVVKADIQEEIDRLVSHIAEAKSLLGSNKPVGRRLDFLCQEFNREANTLCSKSSDTALTKIGLDLKVLIDQFREQVQNIE